MYNCKKCPKCNLLLSKESFGERPSGILRAYCKNCQKEYDRIYWFNNKSKRNRQKRLSDKKIRERNGTFIIKYLKKQKCADCGNKDFRVLEFDHKNRKTANISDMVGKRYSIKKIKEEIKKCEVRCANCHRLKTAINEGWYSYQK